MPIEIRELVIKAKVGASEDRQDNSTKNNDCSCDKDEVLDVITKQVTEFLNGRKER
jgi:Family of unknown function (DUF5908)